MNTERTDVDTVPLAAIDERLSQCTQDPAILVLRGEEGARRTALAANWSMAHRERFTGGVLYEAVDSYRVGVNRSVRITAVVAAMLVSLGTRPGLIPISLQDRVGLFRRLTGGDPVLVVLDGVDEPAQVRCALPAAPGSVIIATTRGRMAELSLDGAVYLDLPQ